MTIHHLPKAGLCLAFFMAACQSAPYKPASLPPVLQVQNPGCAQSHADRAGRDLREIFETVGLQTTHRKLVLPAAQQKTWAYPSEEHKTRRWRSFGEIATRLEKLNGGHEGVDINGRTGDAIYAASAGTVVYAMTHCQEGDRWCGNGWGNHLVIDHGDGLFTRYAHLNRVQSTVGQSVTAGLTIAELGNTGLSDGPHLHFEIGQKSSPFNACAAPQNFDGGVYDPRLLAWPAP